MSYDETDLERELREDAIDKMFREWLPDAVWQQSADIAARYLRTFGDAVQDRVRGAVNDARALTARGHHEAALVRAFTAFELTVSYLLFRPLFFGVLLSEELADQIVRAILNGKAERERMLLPTVLKHWGVPLDQVVLTSGRSLWDATTKHPNSIRDRRNDVVHCGASATAADASEAIQAAELLLEKVVSPLAKQLGFTLDATGKWSEIGRPPYTKTYPSQSPFKGDK
jgi:hypothetical protein